MHGDCQNAAGGNCDENSDLIGLRADEESIRRRREA